MTTGTLPVVEQLPSNVAIRHIVNSLLHISGPFRCLYPAFRRFRRCADLLPGFSLFGIDPCFGFTLRFADM